MTHLLPIQLTSGSVSASLHTDHATEALTAASAPPLETVAHRCQLALSNPLDFPELVRCVVPGDRVVLAVDPETPYVTDIIGRVWELLQSVPDGGVLLTLLLPKDSTGTGWQAMRDLLPLHVQQQIAVHVHEPDDASQISYIASSSGGERIYLNRHLSDADLIITVGVIAFDRALGFRGTSSILFPAFSDTVTQASAQSQGHPELTPTQQRSLRELVDEVGWLLGTQFTVQVVPGASERPADILAGSPQEVMNRGKEIVEQTWRMKVDDVLSGVVISVPGGTYFGWRQLGQALENVSSIIQQGGRIAVVAELPEPDGPAATMLRRCQDPDELLKPLRREPTSDSVEISQLIQALRRARIYLLSSLAPEIVEELGMIPLADAAELQKLASSMSDLRVIPNANYAWCEQAD